ncbi:MAG TPA: hypothetical protein VGS12_05395 [Caulobacteraceae bacterium]|nr:hypothetical protein [Caulobacteraceae bacterium]
MTSPLAHTEPAPGPEGLESALAAWGVIKIQVDHFHVGSYRYTNALDALAEAKRQRTHLT